MAFHYDITTEDVRMIAHSPDGLLFAVILCDAVTGEGAANVDVPASVIDANIAIVALEGVAGISKLNAHLYLKAEVLYEGIDKKFRLIP